MSLPPTKATLLDLGYKNVLLETYRFADTSCRGRKDDPAVKKFFQRKLTTWLETIPKIVPHDKKHLQDAIEEEFRREVTRFQEGAVV